MSRKLVDSNTFQRSVPSFGLDASEVEALASPGCPPAFISLALDCVLVDVCTLIPSFLVFFL